MSAGPRVEFADFGAWGRRSLIAEYDAERDAIRLNADAVARVCATHGPAAAARLVASALAHERFHRAWPAASEAAAHAHVQAVTGFLPERFEALVRESYARKADGPKR